MSWEKLKDKILVFGENDYVFADMFISILLENQNNNISVEDIKILLFKMLNELMNEKLINVFILKNEEKNGKKMVINISYSYKNINDIENFIGIIDKEWVLLNYKFPKPNELFWVTTSEKGKSIIKNC